MWKVNNNLNLGKIMSSEFMYNVDLPHEERVAIELREAAYVMMREKSRYHREDVVLKRENCDSSELLSNTSPYFHDGTFIDGTGDSIRKIYYLWENYYIQKYDYKYEMFFAYTLKQVSLFGLDNFLNHQLSVHYDNNKTTFSRFIRLLFREYDHVLNDEKKKITVEEWIAFSNKKDEIVTEKKKTKKEEKNIPDIIFDDRLELFYKIEKRLIRDGYIITLDDGKLKWNKTKEQLIAIILILYQYGYFNTALFDQKSYEYRKVFEKQYNISLEQEFKKNRRSKINVESYMPIFSFIRHPLSSRR